MSQTAVGGCCPWLYHLKNFSPQFFNSPSGSGGLQLDLSLPHKLHKTNPAPSTLPWRFPLGSSCQGGLPQSLLLLLSSLLEPWRGNPGTLLQLLSYQHWVERDNNFALSAGHTHNVASMRWVLSVIREYAVGSFSAWRQPPGPFHQGKMSIKMYASLGVGGMQSSKPAIPVSSSTLSKKKKKSLWCLLVSMWLERMVTLKWGNNQNLLFQGKPESLKSSNSEIL